MKRLSILSAVSLCFLTLMVSRAADAKNPSALLPLPDVSEANCNTPSGFNWVANPVCLAVKNDNSASESYAIGGVSDNGTGVNGSSANNEGVLGSSQTGIGVHAYSISGSNGLLGENFAYGVGVHGKSYGGVGVQGESTSSVGVYGTSQSNDALQGFASDPSRSGLFAVNTGGGGYGVFTRASGTGQALHAENTTGGWAGYFIGNLAVTGVPYSTNNSTFLPLSDLRLKKNVKPLEGALEHLMRLRGVTFEWKDSAAHGNQTGIQSGFIAQEIEKVDPTWVSTDPDGMKHIGAPGYAFQAMLVESIKTLKAENDAQNRIIQKQEDRIKALERERGPVTASTISGSLNWTALGAWLPIGAVVLLRARKRRRTEQPQQT